MKYIEVIVANLGRNKLRTVLTGVAVMLAVLLVCILLTMPAGMNFLLENLTNNTRISVHNKAGIVYPMPAAFTRKVRAVDGVEAAMAQTWFGGAYEEKGVVTFPNFAVEVEHVEAVYPDYKIPREQLDAFVRYRDGAIVGRQTMLRYKWKIGDRITLKSTVWPVDLDLRIVGEVPNDRAPMLWLNRIYLDEALKAKGWPGLRIAGMIWVRAADAAKVNAIMGTIDEMFRNSEAETACETEASFFANFFGSLQGLVTIIMIVTGLVALCIVFIAANTSSMAVRERAGEIATLKAIGFSRRVIFAMLVAEAMTLSLLAGGTGVLLATGMTRALQRYASWSDALGPLAGFIITPQVVVQGLVLSIVVGVLAGVLPAYGAARKPVVDALREVF